jgi:hypothetical protein
MLVEFTAAEAGAVLHAVVTGKFDGSPPLSPSERTALSRSFPEALDGPPRPARR